MGKMVATGRAKWLRITVFPLGGVESPRNMRDLDVLIVFDRSDRAS
jgi:hypothetical protein